MVTIGLISDTHGMMRPSVHSALAGVDMILHAGDVCGDDILIELDTIAPVTAVYGNCDPPGHVLLSQSIDIVIEGASIHVSHGHELGRPRPEQLLATYPDAGVIIFGHTHRQLVHTAGSRLVVNPGSAGPRRFDLAPSVARLVIDNGSVTAELVPLE